MSTICTRQHSISLLLSNDPDLLDFLFTPCRTRLNWETPAEAAFATGMMDRERSVLVRIALDIWNSTGFSRLPEVYQQLNEVRFEAFTLALESLWGRRGCHCISCVQRLHPALGSRATVSGT